MKKDILDKVGFYDLMQNYRIANMDNQENVTKRFEEVKKFIRKNFAPKKEIKKYNKEDLDSAMSQLADEMGWLSSKSDIEEINETIEEILKRF